MSIAQFIRESILQPRLKQSGCLVVYDPDARYREQCFDLASDKVRVIDSSHSSIESREHALAALREVGQPKTTLEAVLIYVPTKPPDTDEQKQIDPFAVYSEIGSIFPRDDGDEFLSICLRAKPDYATEIRHVFSGEGNAPSFAVIDAIGEGVGWPQLRATLNVDSGREILIALLAPTSGQIKALKDQEGWTQEARDFLRATLTMSVATRGKGWPLLADELWRFVLFSEFSYGLAAALPDALKSVPHAPKEAQPIIEDVCDRLRSDPKFCISYIERAESIEAELNLEAICSGASNIGARDTFPFEERIFLRKAIQGITEGNTDYVRSILTRYRNSVWLGKGDSQAQWELIRAGLVLIEACDDYERQLPKHVRSQENLLDFYLGSLREVDRLQREFEQASGDFLDQGGMMHEITSQARARYSRLAEKVQDAFVKHLEISGWPPVGRMANSEVFDRLVSDRLKVRGHKVAYLMVDALRYELGVALEKLLAEDGPVELLATYAQFPTITLVGMASLLPGARADLRLTLDDDVLVPKLAGANVTNVNQRMDVLGKRLGDRFDEMVLGDFVRGKVKISDTVDLIVLRSTEIDSQLESNPETTLSLIPATLKLIRVALHKLKGMGFKEAIIVTDHGFFLNSHAEAGDVCAKPMGNWPINSHDRMMLGSGSSDSHSIVISAEKVGIFGDFSQIAIPRSMAPYRAGHLYFHGGASLAEAVVPVLVAKLDGETQTDLPKVSVEITYKNGAKRITTQLPVIEISLACDDMFFQESGLELLIEAQDSKGNVIGESRMVGDVNPATRTVTLATGERKQVALRMDEGFRGKFSIKALNPITLVAYSNLALETDYTE